MNGKKIERKKTWIKEEKEKQMESMGEKNMTYYMKTQENG